MVLTLTVPLPLTRASIEVAACSGAVVRLVTLSVVPPLLREVTVIGATELSSATAFLSMRLVTVLVLNAVNVVIGVVPRSSAPASMAELLVAKGKSDNLLPGVVVQVPVQV